MSFLYKICIWNRTKCCSSKAKVQHVTIHKTTVYIRWKYTVWDEWRTINTKDNNKHIGQPSSFMWTVLSVSNCGMSVRFRRRFQICGILEIVIELEQAGVGSMVLWLHSRGMFSSSKSSRDINISCHTWPPSDWTPNTNHILVPFV